MAAGNEEIATLPTGHVVPFLRPRSLDRTFGHRELAVRRACLLSDSFRNWFLDSSRASSLHSKRRASFPHRSDSLSSANEARHISAAPRISSTTTFPYFSARK